jgi:hypothetical protein
VCGEKEHFALYIPFDQDEVAPPFCAARTWSAGMYEMHPL